MQYEITKLVIVGIFVQGVWFGLYLVGHAMDAGRVLSTFYAGLAAIQSIETILSQCLVLAKGVSAGRHLKCIMAQTEHSRHVNHLVGLEPTASLGDIEVKEVIPYTSLRDVLIRTWHRYHLLLCQICKELY